MGAGMTIIGCLYHKKSIKGWSTFVELAKRLPKNLYEFVSFGAYDLNVPEWIDLYMANPTPDKKRLLYNICDIWFSPVTLEGWHNVAAEANLCNCLVVCNRIKSNGMGDYATDETAMRYNTIDEAVRCCIDPDWSKVRKMQNVLKNKIGGRCKNMKRLADLLT